MKKQYLECGKIVAVHALKGEVRVQPWMDSPNEMCELKTLYFDSGKERLEIEKSRVSKNVVILKIKGIDTPEDAQSIRNRILFLNRDDVTVPEGKYFIQDLIGLEVYDADSGEKYGDLFDVTETGANNVYHIRFLNGDEKLIPAIKQVVIKTDIDSNRMEIRPLEGLFDI